MNSKQSDISRIKIGQHTHGEGVSTHTAPGDALLQVQDGEALVTIDGKEMTAPVYLSETEPGQGLIAGWALFAI